MRFNEAKCTLGRFSNCTLLECNSGHIFLSNSNREEDESGPDAPYCPILNPAGLGVKLLFMQIGEKETFFFQTVLYNLLKTTARVD